MHVNLNVTVWELHLDLDSMNEVHPLSNRCRTRWIIESAEIGGHSELPLWERPTKLFLQGRFLARHTNKNSQIHQRLSVYPSLPPSSVHPWCLIHTHLCARRCREENRKTLKGTLCFSAPRLSFHCGSIFPVNDTLIMLQNIWQMMQRCVSFISPLKFLSQYIAIYDWQAWSKTKQRRLLNQFASR